MNNYFGIDLAKEGSEYTSASLIDNINTILTVPARQEPNTVDDIIDCITKMGALLDENNHSEKERYLILPPASFPNKKLKSRAWKKAFKKDVRNFFYSIWRPNKKQWYNNNKGEDNEN